MIESIFYRVIEGRIPYKGGLYIYDPSFRVKSIGQKIYYELLKFKEDDILLDRDIVIFLTEQGIWNNEKEKKEEEKRREEKNKINKYIIIITILCQVVKVDI